MILQISNQTPRNKEAKERGQQRHTLEACNIRHALDALEHNRHPWVVRIVLEATEGFTKSQVANNVKGREVEPLLYIQWPLSIGTLNLQLLEQRVDIFADDWLLLYHSLG